MANSAILSRGGTSVSIDLLGEGGELALARDIGKPTQELKAPGVENPRRLDYQHAGDAWTITGFLIGSSAYSDARTLASKIIKPRLDSPLELDLSSIPQRSTYDVVPAGQSACSLTYEPGVIDIVGVQLTVPIVQGLQGGDQRASTPGTPGFGSGIKLSRASGASITLDPDTSLTRTVGRPGIELNPTNGELPIAIDENTSAQETWTISSTLLDSPNSTAQTLEEELFRPRFGGDAMTLEFLSNQWALRQYDVTPVGSQALRTVYTAGEQQVVNVPTIELQTIRAE